MELTEEALRAAAGERTFRHGEEAVDRVHGLRVTATAAHGSVQGRRVHVVELDWSSADLVARCTCGAEDVCRHAVALGVAALDEAVEPVSIDEQLARLGTDDLRELLAELAARDPAVARMVALRADGAAPGLVDAVDAALSTRGFVDYRRSFDVARDAHDLLDELEAHLDAGAADAVRPALLRALTELRGLGEQADDSGGVLGDACQRAADLHARSCREGSPDGVRLARWLLDFRAASPGWPETPLAQYVGAFDAEALAVYADGVAALVARFAGADRFERADVDRMQVELADHRGDVDTAIAVLASGEPPAHGAIVRRLRDAGRDAEVLEWMDRAVRTGWVGHRAGDHRLDPADVAATFLAAGRERAALDVLRAQVRSSPGFATFAALVRFAKPLGHRDTEREWALGAAREAAGTHLRGAPLIEIALGEGDLAAAWDAAQRYGAGHCWRELAVAAAATMPRQAAELYRPAVEEELKFADTGRYPGIADMLATMRDLYAAAGEDAEFAAYVTDIRTRFRRRSSLIRELDRRSLT